MYYSSRMEAVSLIRTVSLQPTDFKHPKAWREENEGVANFMLQKITGKPLALILLERKTAESRAVEHDQRLSQLPPSDVRIPAVIIVF